MSNPTVKIVAETLAGVKICEFQNAKRKTFTKFLSSVGELVFDLKYDDVKFANLTGIKSVLKVYRNGTAIWAGNYDYLSESKNGYSVFASSFERLLSDYLVEPTVAATSTSRLFTSKKLGTEMAQVLFEEAKAKTDSNLSTFTVGTIENPYTPSTTTEMSESMEFDYNSTFEAIKSIAYAGKADFEITPAKVFNFYRRKGVDKPNIVFRLKGNEPSNITNYKREVDYRSIGNKIYAFGVGTKVNFLKSTQTDATSQTTYGLIERNLGIPKSLVDQEVLDKLTAERIKVTKNPTDILSPTVVIRSGGIDLFDGWDLGDNARIIISRGLTSIDKYMRIIGVQVSYSDTGAENVYIYLQEKES